MKIQTQIRVLFAIILANFIAQVPYSIHQYGFSFLTNIRGILLLGIVFFIFLAGYILLLRKQLSGYRLLVGFLAVEFAFYALTLVGEVAQGFGPFYHLSNPSLLLRIVFGIGYLNLFASGYFLYLLARNKEKLLTP